MKERRSTRINADKNVRPSAFAKTNASAFATPSAAADKSAEGQLQGQINRR
jgi:hypothetical protein